MRVLRLPLLALAIVSFVAGAEVAFAAPGMHGPVAPPLTPIPIQSGNICTMQYQPVCAWRRGRTSTYSNACHAERNRATVIHRGQCRGGYREYSRRPRDEWRRDCVRVGPVYVCER